MAKTKKKSGILTASDIMKGFTALSNAKNIWTLQPLQSIPLKEKTSEWIEWNANWCEQVALRELPKKAKRLQKLYNLAAGVINKSDYIDGGELANHFGIIGADEEQDLLNQFWGIIPNIISVFYGEQIKRDRSMIVQAKDQESVSEVMEYKESLVKQILENQAVMQKQFELASIEMSPGEKEEQVKALYEQEMASAQSLVQAQTKFKNYRTIAEQWSQKFIDLFGTRERFVEEELWAFMDSLISDEAIFFLNLRENDFSAERWRPQSSYINISPRKKYYSECNFAVNIEFMSIPDIINTFRNELSSEQVESLETLYINRVSENIIFSDQNGRSSTYYDNTKSYDWNMRISSGMKEEISADIVKDYIQDSLKGEVSNYNSYVSNFSDSKLIRVSKIIWSSQKKVGLLTKIEEDGSVIKEDIDENFIITEPPIYDKSLLKEESAKTLISGEHIDWKYTTEWRYVVKIGENLPYWNTNLNTEQNTIYLFGSPIRFQFKNDGSIYGSKPPLEGCRFSLLDTRSVSLVEKLKPWQLIYNAMMNKVVKSIPKDLAKILLVGASSIKQTSLLQEDGMEPVFEFLDSIKENQLAVINDSKEAAQDRGSHLVEPRMYDMSNIDHIASTIQIASSIKWQAFEIIGVSPQRMSQIGKSETASGIQMAVETSVNQTEIFFQKFNNDLMPRVWEMILSAGQYYTAMSDTFAESYLTSDIERVFFSVNKVDALMRDLHVSPQSNADVRQLMQSLRQLTLNDNTMGATFLDKIKAYTSKSPSKIIQQLQESEDLLNEKEQKRFQQQQQMQQQMDENRMKLEQEVQNREDARLQAKLENARYIAELEAGNMPAPIDNSNKDGITYQNLQNQQQNQADKMDLENRKLSLEEQKHKDEVQIKRDKLQVEREKNRTSLQVALQNKNSADIKFKQKK